MATKNVLTFGERTLVHNTLQKVGHMEGEYYVYHDDWSDTKVANHLNKTSGSDRFNRSHVYNHKVAEFGPSKKPDTVESKLAEFEKRITALEDYMTSREDRR